MDLKSFVEHKIPELYNFLVSEKYFIDSKNNKKLIMEHGPEALIRKLYTKYFGKEPDLDDPKTFNEKLMWLKLHWYDERALVCSSKAYVHEYVKTKGLGDILIEQYGVYDKADDINFDVLPDSFVLKPSHDSGHIIVCKDKKRLNLRKTRKMLDRWLLVDYEYKSGEWPYHAKKKIVCEKLMVDDNIGELLDYKLFCFNSEPKFVFFVSDRAHHAKSDFYDMDWNKQDFRWYYEPSDKVFPKPKNFEKMKEYARILSDGFPFVRVDFYEINGEVYFGELTFFHGGGLGWFKPEEIDRKFGDLLTLPQKSIPSPWEIIHPELKGIINK